MNHAHITALAQAWILYLILGLACLGWGRILAAVWGREDPKTHPHVALLWIGWTGMLGIFQALHILFPLTVAVVGPVLLTGVALSVPDAVRALRPRKQIPSRPWRLVALIACVLGVSGWVASRAMLPFLEYDAGLYHLTTIRWIREYPLVPGLGNLHGRLAFNQSFFTWAAALDLHPWFGHGRAIATSFLFLLTLGTLAAFLRSVWRDPSILWSPASAARVLALLLGLEIIRRAVYSTALMSPSPDFASACLQITLLVLAADWIAGWRHSEKAAPSHEFALVLLSAMAITVKLSNAGYAIAMMLLVAVRCARTRSVGRAARMGIPAGLILAVWMARGYVLSGVPFYPSCLGYLSAEWSVPREKISEEAQSIRIWARQPGVTSPRGTKEWEWISPWIQRMAQHKVRAVYPLAAAGFLMAGTVAAALIRHRFRIRPVRTAGAILLFPVLLALGFWWVVAPDPRFAAALFACLAAAAALTFLETVQPLLNTSVARAGMLGLVWLLVNAMSVSLLIRDPFVFTIMSTSGWHPVPSVSLVKRTTRCGLEVFTPAEGDQCWDAPLPCTPYFNPNLRLRVPGRMSAGFTVQPPPSEARDASGS